MVSNIAESLLDGRIIAAPDNYDYIKLSGILLQALLAKPFLYPITSSVRSSVSPNRFRVAGRVPS